jgi:hypothetical protein
MVCQIQLKWSQQRIIVKKILHNMCQVQLCTGARFTVYSLYSLLSIRQVPKKYKTLNYKKNQTKPREQISSLLNFKFFGPKPSWPEHERVLATLAEWRARIRSRIRYSVAGSGTWAIRGSVLDQCNCVVIERRMCGREGTDMSMVLPTNPHVVLLGKGGWRTA